MRESRMRRAMWRELETWPGWNGEPTAPIESVRVATPPPPAGAPVLDPTRRSGNDSRDGLVKFIGERYNPLHGVGI